MELKQDQTQLNSVSCYLPPLGKLSDASWDGLRVQKSYRLGLEVWKSYKTQRMPNLFRQLWGSRLHRCSVTLELHPKVWQKNDGNGLLQDLIICKEERSDFIKNKQTNRFLSGATSSVCQTPSFSVLLPWEPFPFYEWWPRALSCRQLSELNGCPWINSLMLAARTRQWKRGKRKKKGGAMFENKRKVSQLPKPQSVEGCGGGSRLWQWKAKIV